MPSIKKVFLTLTAAFAMTGMLATPVLADQNRFRGQGVQNVFNNGYNNGFRNGVNRVVVNNRNNRNGRVVVNNFNRGNVGFVGVNRFNNRGFVNNRNFNNFNRRNGLNGTGAAVLGVGAGLVTLALLNQSRQNQQPQTVIVQNTQPVNAVPQGNFNQNIAYNQASTCLQVREYQTTVIVGGTPQNAYGSACLQQDGSWLQGPAAASPF